MPDRLDHAPCGFVEFDDDGIIACANSTLATWLGTAPSALVGRKFESLLTIANKVFFQTRFFPLLNLHGKAEFRDSSRRLRVTIRGQVLRQNAFEATKDRYHYMDFVRIEVRDNGSGFDPEYRDYVFQLLKKVQLESPGMGMGLVICRKIATLHYGTIQADPQPNVGTTFTLTLPSLQHEV